MLPEDVENHKNCFLHIGSDYNYVHIGSDYNYVKSWANDRYLVKMNNRSWGIVRELFIIASDLLKEDGC